jgi:hypothetical protein
MCGDKAPVRKEGVKVKFRIFDNRLKPDDSFIECLCCGAKASFSEGVDMTIRAPRKESDLVRDL